MIRTAPKSTKSWLRTVGHLAVRAWRSVALLEDTPHRIALGSAVGAFFAFQPLVIGGQMAWAAGCARLLRGNMLASLPWSWLTNPLTVAPIYYGCYRLGRVIAPVGKDIGFEDIRAIYGHMDDLGLWGAAKEGWRLIVDIVVPLQIGCAIAGLAAAAAVYFGVLRLTRWAQRRRFLRRSEWLGAMRRTRDADGEPPAASDVR